MNNFILKPEGTPFYHVEPFYPDIQFLEKRISRQGDFIAVLNGFVPSALNAGEGAAFYVNFRRHNSLAIGADFIAQKEIIPLWGNSRIRVNDFDEFFLTWYPNPITITNSQWTTNLDEELSTPILVFIGNEIDLPGVDFAEKSFRYGFTSPIPTTAGTSTIQIRHGYMPKNIKVVLVVDTAANPLNVEVRQRNLRGSSNSSDVNVNPSVFPYSQTFNLPDRDSPETQVIITGGGAAETGQLSFVVILTPY